MARPTDHEKLDRIKAVTMSLIAENGYQGITIADIAKEAKVSAGYLYNHFESKDHLIISLIDDCHMSAKDGVMALIEAGAPFKDLIRLVYTIILSMANEDPTRARFIYALSHDTIFRDYIESSESKFDIIESTQMLMDFAKEKGYVDALTTIGEMMVYLIDLPVSYMHYHIKHLPAGTPITDSDIERLVVKTVKALE